MKPSAITTPEGRKRGNVPVLAQLKPDQHAKLLQWLTIEGVTLETARDRLKEQFGIALSLKPIHHFFHEYAAPLLEHAALATPDHAPLEVLIEAAGIRIHITAPAGAVVTTKGAK